MNGVTTPTRRRAARRPATAVLAGDGGFTLIEVLVASVLLLVGAFATLALLDNGAQATSVSRQADVGNAAAQEVIERATGGRYTLATNDMTDFTAAGAGPADRLRAAMGDATSAVSPATPAAPFAQPTPQSWTLRRSGTDYTVSYVACTQSDRINNTESLGPYDCGLTPTSGGGNPPTQTTNGCTVATRPINADGSVGSSVSSGAVGISLQILGALGLQTCLDLEHVTDALSPAVCSLANAGALGTPLASLVGENGLLGGIARVNAGVDNCPSQVERPLASAVQGTATATKVTVAVRWTDRKGRARQIDRVTLVRRPVQ